jgi:hypothetical protein
MLPHDLKAAPLLLAALFVPSFCCSQAATSSANAGAPAGLDEITVIAPKPPTAEQIAGENVMTFIRSHSKPVEHSTGLVSLGRWKGAVCVKTEGLSQAFNDFVSARVQAIALAVRVPQETRSPCVPNVLVIFTTEPQRLMDDVANRRPQLLGFHYVSQVPKIKTVDRPIQAWHVTATLGGIDLVVDDIWTPMPSSEFGAGQTGSRITTGLSSFIVFTLVVVDTNKVTGYGIGSISDYIAMVTLAQIRLADGCGRLPSILDLMAAACAPPRSDAITGGDIAYLKALYTVGLARDIRQQRDAIEIMMKQEFAAGSGPAARDPGRP